MVHSFLGKGKERRLPSPPGRAPHSACSLFNKGSHLKAWKVLSSSSSLKLWWPVGTSWARTTERSTGRGCISLSQGPEALRLEERETPAEARHPVRHGALLVHSHMEGGASLLLGNRTVHWSGAVQAHKGAWPVTKGFCFLRADITRQPLSELIKGWLHPGWSACQPPGPHSSWQQAL